MRFSIKVLEDEEGIHLDFSPHFISSDMARPPRTSRPSGAGIALSRRLPHFLAPSLSVSSLHAQAHTGSNLSDRLFPLLKCTLIYHTCMYTGSLLTIILDGLMDDVFPLLDNFGDALEGLVSMSTS